MANEFLIINEKDWEKMRPDQREWVTFNTMQSMHNRLIALEKKAWVNKACSTMGGMLGGITAVLGFKIAG